MRPVLVSSFLFAGAIFVGACSKSNPGSVADGGSAGDGGSIGSDFAMQQDDGGGGNLDSGFAQDFGSGIIPDGGLGGGAKIKHVVIIIQENRTVDNMFNGFPGADTVTMGPSAKGGGMVTLQPMTLVGGKDMSHQHGAFLSSYNNGAQDGFPYPEAYTYVPKTETVPYWTMAQQYTFGDHMFQSNTGPSFPAHQYLIAGHSGPATLMGLNGFACENPNNVNVGGAPWGCDGDPMTDRVNVLLSNSTELPNAIYPCFDYVTLADIMDKHNVSWRYYAPTVGMSGGIWSAFQAVQHIRRGPDWAANVISPETTILTDVPAGKLAAVTWVAPSGANSDHLAQSQGTGPHWVASIVNAIGNSPFWQDTAIIIVWDDWGGFYDHVKPPMADFMGLGFRVPLIVVSPYAKRGYVSKVQHEFGSILHFTEEALGLPSIHSIDPQATDDRADDLADCFDFNQTPGPYVPLPTHLTPQYFVSQPPSNEPPDDDE